VKTKRTSNSNGNGKLNVQEKSGVDAEASFIGPKEIRFTIKELADFSGIKPHTIRIWEQRFTFLNPQRTETSRRYYTGQQVIFFLQICLLKNDGHRMTHIAKMSNDERNEIITCINGPQKYIRIIFELISCMINVDMFRFNNVLDKSVRDWGIHETLHCVILPFAERTCLFENPEKKTYKLNLFLVMECIKQKIYLGIESAEVKSQERPTILLFSAGPGELLPLYIHYLIKKEGFTTIYPGKHASFTDLNIICTIKKPDYIISHLPENYRNPDLIEFFNGVADELPHSHFISIGRQLSGGKSVQNYHHIESALDIVTLLNSLHKQPG
jgi:MerR family transcriptional regulator, light-induced transcriptional regulator